MNGQYKNNKMKKVLALLVFAAFSTFGYSQNTIIIKGNVYGGGEGSTTNVAGDVFVNVRNKTTKIGTYDNVSGEWLSGGDVYGGSAFGTVNTDGGSQSTRVTITGGVMNDVYGGGFGQLSNTNPEDTSAHAADVYGNVIVNVEISAEGDTESKIHNVFGCNNVNGEPKKSSVVTIMNTHAKGDFYPILGVYGGGNQAPYSYAGGTKVVVNDGHIEGVYGGGYGVTANVLKTTLNVNGGTIYDGVFGGGELAAVSNPAANAVDYTYNKLEESGSTTTNTASYDTTGVSTNVTIAGGTMPYVFGGGRGSSEHGLVNDGYTPGSVMGSTNLTVSGSATVAANSVVGADAGGGNVYGGGMEGIVLGNTNVSVNGGTYQYLFAGGRGFSGSTSTPIDITDVASNDAGFVYGNTNLTMSNGTINKDMFGGGEGRKLVTAINAITQYDTVASVRGNANLVMKSGTVDGSVFGGGSLANVLLSAYSNYEGGSVHGNVYGGGKLGTVGRVDGSQNSGVGTVVTLNGGYIEGSAFAGCYGVQDTIMVSGTRTFNFLKGNVVGNVYGGSYSSSDALKLCTKSTYESVIGSNAVTDKVCFINYYGGSTARNLYGGGYYGTIYGGNFVHIGTRAADFDSRADIRAANTQRLINFEPIAPITIGGSVYAGSDWGEISETSDASVKASTGTTNIYVNGYGYNTGAAGDAGKHTMTVANSIYGCGTTTDGGVERVIYLRNYGAVATTELDGDTLAPATTSRSLYTIQRCDSLLVDNSNITLSGKGDVSSFSTTILYSLYNTDNVVVANRSVVRVISPMENIKTMKSAKAVAYTDGKLNIETLGFNDIVAAPADPCTGEGSYTGPKVDASNTLIIGNGAYAAIRYKDENGLTKHGPLYGYFFMRSSQENAVYAYARPKVTSAMDDHYNEIQYSTPANTDDGGFICFDNINQYDPALGYERVCNDSPRIIKGNEYAYQNGPFDIEGYFKFRYWSYNSNQTSYRDGVLVAKSDLREYDEDDMLVASCEISLPTLNNQGDYYIIKSIRADEEITLEYAGIYDYDEEVTSNSKWVYKDELNMGTTLNENDSHITGTISNIKSAPNHTFGLVMVAGESLESGKKQIINTIDGVTNIQFPVAAITGLQTMTFNLTYSNKLSNNVDLGTILIELEEHTSDGSLIGYTVIRLQVYTVGDIPQNKELTTVAVMNEARGDVEDEYTVKMVLPRLNLMDKSDFWITGFELMGPAGVVGSTVSVSDDDMFYVDEETGNVHAGHPWFTLVKNNEIELNTPDNPLIAVSFGAAENSDKTDGWISKGTTCDIASLSGYTTSGSNSSEGGNGSSTPTIAATAFFGNDYTGSWNMGDADSDGRLDYLPAGTADGACFTPASNDWVVPESWQYIGQVDGRSLFSIDFNVKYLAGYNMDTKFNKQDFGGVRFKFVYSRWETETVEGISVAKKRYYLMDVDVKVKIKTNVSNFYVDGVNGKNTNDGTTPFLAKKTIQSIIEDPNYTIGDIVYVVNTVTVDRTAKTVYDGYSVGNVQLRRYDGGHLTPKEEGSIYSVYGFRIPTYDSTEGADNSEYEMLEAYNTNYPSDAPFTGVILDVRSDLTMSSIYIDGSGGKTSVSVDGQSLTKSVQAEQPIVTVSNGAKFVMLDRTVIFNNNNTASDALAGGIYIDPRSSLEMSGSAAVKDNVVKEVEDLIQAGGIYVDGSIIMGQSNVVADNSISSGVNRNSNVVLPSPEKRIEISMITDDEGFAIEGDPSFTENAKIGVTKDLNRQFHFNNPERYNWFYDVDTTRIAYSMINSYLLSYNVTDYTLTDDKADSDVTYDDDKYSPQAVYFNEPQSYWVDVVTEQPAGYQVDLFTQDITISSEEGLAWLISEIYGYNNVTHAHDFENVNITLTKDIDMSAHRWTPLGASDAKFKGSFDGGENTIKGIIASEPLPYMGLFGYVEDGSIKDVTLSESKIFGNGFVGSIAATAVGVNDTVKFENCNVTDNMLYANIAEGGVVGTSTNATINKSNGNNQGNNDKDSEDGAVEFRGNSIYVGGVAGLATNSTISNSYVKMINLASGDYAGMIVGSAADNSVINNNGAILFANGDSDNVLKRMGGVAGQLSQSQAANNYAVGELYATNFYGGAVGELNNNSSVENCFWITGGEWNNNNLPAAGKSDAGTSVTNSNEFTGRGVNCFVNPSVNGNTSLVDILNAWIASTPDSLEYDKWIPDAHNDYYGFPVFGTEVPIIPVEATRSVNACSQYEWHDTILYEDGTYNMVWRDNYNYIDSVLTLKLSVHQPYSINLDDQTCYGYGYDANGLYIPTDSMPQAGDYTFIRMFESQFGCDSLVTLTLKVNPTQYTEFTEQICEGEIFNEHGFNFIAEEAGSFGYDNHLSTVNGCDSLVHLNLTVNALPQLVLNGITTIVEGDSAYLEVSGADNFEWSTGETGNTVVLAPLTTTDYHVIGYNETGCETELEFTVKVLAYNEIPESEVPFDVYPNPTHNKVKVATYGIERIELVSPIGQVLVEAEPQSNEYVLDLSDFANGTYIVRVVTPYGVKVRPVVKK